MSYLFLVSCSVLFVVPLYFVAHSVYKDGVFGRASLLGISFCAAGILGEASVGTAFYVPNIVVLLVTCFAVFCVWHLCRFHFRVVRKDGQWKPIAR